LRKTALDVKTFQARTQLSLFVFPKMNKVRLVLLQ
jgi:hypothetical protein